MDNYRVVFEGNWSDADRAVVMAGVAAFSAALARHTGTTPIEAFNCVMGGLQPVVFVLERYLKYDGFTSGNTIKLKPGRITERLAAHELGHRLATRLNNAPLRLLTWHGIKLPDGKLLTGSGIGGYSRGGKRYAPANGFRSDHLPDIYCDRSRPTWNSAGEEFPDIVMNWVYATFANNEAGVALYEWMDAHMAEWVACFQFETD